MRRTDRSRKPLTNMTLQRSKLGRRAILVIVWSGTFAAFAFVGISLAITTNPIYSLLIVVGFLMSTLVTDFYRADKGRTASRLDHSCRTRRESPFFVEMKTTFYPRASSEPCLCNLTQNPPRRSYSSPKVQRTPDSVLEEAFLQHCPSAGITSLPCEEVKSFSYHTPYTRYEGRTVGTFCEHDVVEDVYDEVVVNTVDRGGAADERSEISQAKSAGDTVIDVPSSELAGAADAVSVAAKEEPAQHCNGTAVDTKASAESRKPKRRILWNMYAPRQDKSVLKEVRSESSSSSGITPGLASPKSIASAPEYRKVVATIQKNIDEGLSPRKVGGKTDARSSSSPTRRGSTSLNSVFSDVVSSSKTEVRPTPRPSSTGGSSPPLTSMSRSPFVLDSEHQQPPEGEVADDAREDEDREHPSKQSRNEEGVGDEEDLQCLSDAAGSRFTQRVKADLVEVTVINNPPSPARGPARGLQQVSKQVQASCKTSNATVQMEEDLLDAGRSGKPKTKRKLRLIPRFLKGKSKRYKHFK